MNTLFDKRWDLAKVTRPGPTVIREKDLAIINDASAILFFVERVGFFYWDLRSVSLIEETSRLIGRAELIPFGLFFVIMLLDTRGYALHTNPGTEASLGSLQQLPLCGSCLNGTYQWMMVMITISDSSLLLPSVIKLHDDCNIRYRLTIPSIILTI